MDNMKHFAGSSEALPQSSVEGRRRIRVLRIIARLNIGGPAVNASILSSSLDAKTFSTKVIYGSLAKGEGSFKYLMEQQGVDMELVPELGREISPLGDIKAFFKILGIIRRERPDIVHTHTAKAGTLGRMAAALCGVKVKIHTFHGNVFEHYFGPVKTALFVMIERFLGLVTDKVVVLSERQKDDIARRFKIMPGSKCAVIPLGVDISRLSASNGVSVDLRKELAIDDKTVLVGIIGRLVPVKNHIMFLSAAAGVRKRRPDLKAVFVIAGDGELSGVLKSFSNSIGLEDCVRFLGWRDDLAVLYKALDVVALTSLNEGTPLALIEAMACSRPVIATDVGGVGDIVEDGANGILVKKNDLGGFVAGLIRLIESGELRHRLGAEGLKRSAYFSKENLVKNMTKLYLDRFEAKRRKK
ncbi:MAG: glycosyltransferase family 4 protein [Candidatus Omnitrophica bacterium]|nr:glycosyltransferase family 4 protein [Candidatus Omnitrophota bacterium]